MAYWKSMSLSGQLAKGYLFEPHYGHLMLVVYLDKVLYIPVHCLFHWIPMMNWCPSQWKSMTLICLEP